MQSVSSNAIASALSGLTNDLQNYANILVHTEKIGTYTLSANQTLSFKINGFVPDPPDGYSRFTYVYASLQNYCQTSVNFVGDDIYVTMTNHYSGTLTYDLYAFVLYFHHDLY